MISAASVFDGMPTDSIGILLLTGAIVFHMHWRGEMWQTKILDPYNEFVDRYFKPYLIREAAIQRIEGDKNTREVLVVVNHLKYELNNRLKYDSLMAKNINNGVTYYYVLPSHLKTEWTRLRVHLQRAGVSTDNLNQRLQVRFLDEKFTSTVIHGLAIYIGAASYLYRRKKLPVMAVQYSPNFDHSFLVDTSNDNDSGTREIEAIQRLLLSNKRKYRCHE